MGTGDRWCTLNSNEVNLPVTVLDDVLVAGFVRTMKRYHFSGDTQGVHHAERIYDSVFSSSDARRYWIGLGGANLHFGQLEH